MKLTTLNCPSCGAPVEGAINPNQPFTCMACNSTIVSTDWTSSGELICSDCGTENSGRNKYCTSCNSVLQAGCPFCYTQNSIKARYCKQCGVDLQKAWKRQKTWLTERESRVVERRQQIQKIKEESRENLQRLLLKLDEPGNHPMTIPGIVNYGAEALDGLVKLLESRDPDARYGAALALGNIGDQNAIQPLIRSLRDDHPAVRFFAMDALGKLKATEAAQAIGELLDDESPNIRKHANNVLLSFNTDVSFQILREKSRPKWWPFEK